MKSPANETHGPDSTPRFSHANAISDAGWHALAARLALSNRQLQIVRAVAEDATEFAIAANLKVAMQAVTRRADISRWRSVARTTVTSGCGM